MYQTSSTVNFALVNRSQALSKTWFRNVSMKLLHVASDICTSLFHLDFISYKSLIAFPMVQHFFKLPK